MDRFNRLPLDITSNILSRIPTESVIECKLVCQLWRDLIRNPSFSKIHLHRLNLSAADDSGKLGFIVEVLKFNKKPKPSRYYEYSYLEYNENDESIDRVRKIVLAPLFRNSLIVGSCNGLICLAKFSYDSLKYYVCNPITKECAMLPQVQGDFDTEYYTYWTWRSGFGYVSATNEYKVVRVYLFKKSKLVEVHIHTLGSGHGWRNLGKFDFKFPDSCSERNTGQGIFLNGALYWLDDKLEMIITLDLAEEKFSEHLLPLLSPPAGDRVPLHSVCRLGGFLAVSLCMIGYECEQVDIWLLKKKSENQETNQHQSLFWSREYRMEYPVYEAVAVTTSGGVFYRDVNFLSLQKTSSQKKLMKFGGHLRFVLPHRNTLVSLKELGVEDTKIIESGEIEETESLGQPFNQL